MTNENRGSGAARKFALAVSLVVVCVGAAGLAGWVLEFLALKSVFPGLSSMKVNTGVALMLCGGALAVLCLEKSAKWPRMVVGILAGLVALVGALTLGEYLFGWELGIDQALWRIPEAEVAGANAGRMSPSSALSFVFAGAALLMACGRNGRRWRWPMLSALGASVSFLGAIALAGYLFDTLLHFHLWNYTGVAVNTAAGFVLLGSGLLGLVRGEGGLRWSVDGATTAGIVIGMSSLLLVAVASNNFTYRLKQGDQWVSHSQELLKEIDALAASLADLLSSQRGFVITGDEHLLEQEEERKRAIAEDFKKIRDLDGEDAGQQEREKQLEELIAQRIAFGDQTVAARREHGFAEAEKLTVEGEGLTLWRRIRELSSEMRAGEYTLLERRRRESEETSATTFLLLPLGLFVSLTLLFIALFFLNAGVRERLETERELRGANEELRLSEERFRLMVSGVKEYAIYLLDVNGKVASWNAGAQRLKGWRAEEIVGQHCSAFYSPEERAEKKPSKALEIALKKGSFEGEGWRYRKDGTRFWAQVLITALHDYEGRVTGFSMVTRDLTEHRHMEQAIHAEEARLAAVIGSAMDALVTVDEQQRITLFNPAAERMFGCSAAEAMGRSLDQFMPERYRGTHGKHIQAFGMTNTTRRKMGGLDAIYGLRSNGEEFPIEASISQAQVGEDRMYSVILRDITERKQAEEELRQQASLLGLGTVLVRDMDSRIVYWALGAEKLYGYANEEVLGRISHEILNTVFPRPLAQIEEILAKEGKWEGELVHRTREGGKVVVASQWVIYRNTEGTPIRILEFNADITARKRAEQAQLRSQKLEGLGTLAGGIAHDFNNILAAINGNARLAMADLAPDNPVQESLGEIAKAGARATDLVRRILEFSRPTEAKREILNLQPVVEEALRLVRATLPATIEFQTEFARDLPTVEADGTQIHQVIVNLATNAAHAIGEQNGVIEFRLDVTEVREGDTDPSFNLANGEYVRLYVGDNGCGMKRETLERIFDPFFTTKGPGEGTGLGLSVVHGIMTNQGGAIRVYSDEGRGTAFHLYFPIVGRAAESEPKPAQEMQRTRNEHILYVDDEEPLVFLATRMMERMGYKVTGHTDAEAALAEFRARPGDFDVVVTDLSMPKMTGFALAKELLAVRGDVPIVLTSGYVRPEDQERALKMGLRDMILKPNTMDQLGRTLDQLFHPEAGVGRRVNGER